MTDEWTVDDIVNAPKARATLRDRVADAAREFKETSAYERELADEVLANEAFDWMRHVLGLDEQLLMDIQVTFDAPSVVTRRHVFWELEGIYFRGRIEREDFLAEASKTPTTSKPVAYASTGQWRRITALHQLSALL